MREGSIGSIFIDCSTCILFLLVMAGYSSAKTKDQNSKITLNTTKSPIALNITHISADSTTDLDSTNKVYSFPLGADFEAEDDDEDEYEEDFELDGAEDIENDQDYKPNRRKTLSGNKRRHRRKLRRSLDAKSDYLLPENFVSLRRRDIPVTYRLHDDLLRYYRKGTRPVTHPHKIISVSMSVFLYQIIKLDAVKNTISLSGSFELYWQDEFLQWSPDAYEGSTEIFLSSGDIWIPEFSLYYSLNFNDAVKLISNNDVRVNYTGHVRYYLPFSTESLCNSVDVKFFPFDIQQCTLLFGSWAHSNDSIKYSLYSKNLSLIDFYDNQEWQLDLSRSHIIFYYVFNLVIPSAIITLVAVIGFHTPSTSGRMRDAKFRLGIMTLMSMSMILLAIVEDMPKFSISSSRKGRGSFSGIPLIGLYYFMLLAIVGLSTVTSSMFVFVERDVRLRRKIPWYLRGLIVFDEWMESGSSKLGNGLRGGSMKRTPYGCSNTTAFNPFCRSNEDLAASESLLSSTAAIAASGGRLNGHRRRTTQLNETSSSTPTTGQLAGKSYAQSIALSLLRLIPHPQQASEESGGGNHHVLRRESPFSMLISEQPSGNAGGSSSLELGAALASGAYHQETFSNPLAGTLESPPAPQSTAAANRRNLRRKRLSLAHFDNMAIYECFHQLIEEVTGSVGRIEKTVHGIRHELNGSSLYHQQLLNGYHDPNQMEAPDEENDEDSRWQKAIRRLELLSLAFYVTLLFTTMFLFFYHDWYCAIGHNPCGQPNLKCPWMKSDPQHPTCRI
uniref:Neurotransmitter-gated ion-channel ligand-binding domain-containing protein n=1 Tax=Ditylenchus dipsaci TaxID=166011 RepID=A0A915CVV1_9BILA